MAVISGSRPRFCGFQAVSWPLLDCHVRCSPCSTGWLRKYRVRANGKTDQAKLDELRKGIVIEGIEYAGIEAHLDRVQGANVWLTMGLREGKNRQDMFRTPQVRYPVR